MDTATQISVETNAVVRVLTSNMCRTQSDRVAFFVIGMSPMNCIRSEGADKQESEEGTAVLWLCIWVYGCVFFRYQTLTREALDR